MDNGWFVKFEEYLHGRMSTEEKSVFEAELSSNEEMGSAFRIYSTIEMEMGRDGLDRDKERDLKRSLETLNAKYFNSETRKSTKTVSIFSQRYFKAAMGIAAGLLVLLVAYAVFYQPEQNINHLAENYIETHYDRLSQTMDATPDSLQLGISAFNNREYAEALQFFQGVYAKQPENSEAIKNIGLVYLRTGDFEKALLQFEKLAAMENLYSNPGKFLKAITLMQRNEAGDKQEAKHLLEQVVLEDATGREQAEAWLKKF